MTQHIPSLNKDEPRSPPSPEIPCTDVNKLVAFARAYGSVRFFHPTDAAAAADWHALAVEGVRCVRAAKSREELVAQLRETFEPIAPTLRFEVDGVSCTPRVDRVGTGPVVAWQHVGSGFGDRISPYDSARTHRPRLAPRGALPLAWLSSSADALSLRGKTIRLSARVRVQARQRGDWGALFLRVNRAHGKVGYSDYMDDRPILSPEWQRYVLTGEVAEDALSVAFGGNARGRGSVWFADFSLSIVDGTALIPVSLKNPSFDATTGTDGWSTGASGFEYDVVEEDGRHALRVTRGHRVSEGELFSSQPAAFETVEISLGVGLSLELPVALPSSVAAEPPVDAGAERIKLPGLRDAEAGIASRIIAGIEPADSDPGAGAGLIELPGLDDAAVRIASVIVAWNELAHFYPYFDAIDEDWDQVLEQTLVEALQTTGAEDLRVTLERMVSKLHDGHSAVHGPFARLDVAPIRFARAEGRVIVASADEACGLERGDEVESIDGVPIEERIKLFAERMSGSPHSVEHNLLHNGFISRGPPGSAVTVRVRRKGRSLELQASRDNQGAPPVFPHEQFDRLEDGVFYVDLDRAPWADIEDRLPELAAAPGVVFDLRGYPRGNHQILAHLLTGLDTSKWMFLPEILYPRQRDVHWRPIGWGMVPAEPHIRGRVAFIIGPGAISYAESVLGLVEGHGLGALVGAPSAGTNGNYSSFVVPGCICISYTGMKVTRLDGRQHHTIGIQPTIPVAPTLAAITEGRDEAYEAALSFVRGG